MKYLSLYDIIPQEYKDIYDKFYTNCADIEIKVKNGARIHKGDILFVYKFERIKEVITNEYRTVLFAIDHDNIIQSTRILLLNGFLKKSEKDYKKQISKAEKILRNLEL